MAILEIDPAKGQSMEKLEAKSIERVQEFLDGKCDFGDDIKVAMQALNMVSKNRQTSTAREGIHWSMVSMLDNPQLRERYIAASQPQIKKLLGQKRNTG